MINIDQESKSLVRVVKDLIGYRLSTLPAQSGNTTSAVIRNRSRSPKPDLPYATVDYQNLRKVGYSQRDSYLDENENEVDEFDYIGRFIIQINGEHGQDVVGICEELRSRLFTEKGRRKIQEYFETSRLLTTSDVLFFPAFLVTDFEEAARLTVDFWMRSVIVDETNDVIDNISVDGELYDDYDQEYPPITINTNAP